MEATYIYQSLSVDAWLELGAATQYFGGLVRYRDITGTRSNHRQQNSYLHSPIAV